MFIVPSVLSDIKVGWCGVEGKVSETDRRTDIRTASRSGEVIHTTISGYLHRVTPRDLALCILLHTHTVHACCRVVMQSGVVMQSLPSCYSIFYRTSFIACEWLLLLLHSSRSCLWVEEAESVTCVCVCVRACGVLHVLTTSYQRWLTIIYKKVKGLTTLDADQIFVVCGIYNTTQEFAFWTVYLCYMSGTVDDISVDVVSGSAFICTCNGVESHPHLYCHWPEESK